MSHHWPDGEGPIEDPKAAKARAKAERAKPEHRYQRGPQGEPDQRDVPLGEADLDDPAKQKGDTE